MNYDRIYQYRFRGVDQRQRIAAWKVIALDVWRRMGRPAILLDPAAGRGEFINAVPARERWALDRVDMRTELDDAVQFIQVNALEADLPENHFDAVWVSNFLEHLPTQETVGRFLKVMWRVLKPGGVIAVMGPNFRYCAKEYFDCADHVLALTHVAVEEHLYGSGFDIVTCYPRFLPYSFRQRLPPSPSLVSLYLHMPFAWHIFGKQFLVIGRKPTASGDGA